MQIKFPLYYPVDNNDVSYDVTLKIIDDKKIEYSNVTCNTKNKYNLKITSE